MTETVTSQQESRQLHKGKLEDILIVDADVHVHEPPADLAPYCDEPWNVALDNLKKYDLKEWYGEIPGFSPGIQHGGYQAQFPHSYDHERLVLTPEEMRNDLTEMDIDIGVLFPDHLLKLAVLPQVDYAAAVGRAYNAWLLDTWCKPEMGLLGCVIACPQDPEDTAREIEKYSKEPGMVGVYLPCAGVDPLYGHRKYDPIWEAAQAADWPVLLHAATVTHPVFPFNNQGFDTELARHACSHTFSMMSNIIHMITTGVQVRYPNLRIAVTEAGISWVPFVMHRLDKEYLQRRREVPFLEDRPSEYVKQIYFATQPIEEPENLGDLAKMMELFDGENNVIFASDWPHHDFDHPMKVNQIPFASNEARRKVFGENALRLFNIDAQGRRQNL